MPVNLLRRTIKVNSPSQSSVTEQMFYVVWHRGDREYFLSESNDAGTDLFWTTDRTKAVGLIDGGEALELCNEVKKTRTGPGIIELKVVDVDVNELQTEFIWAI